MGIVEEKVLKVGQKVRIKPHCINIWNDYKEHTGEIAEIYEYDDGGSLRWQIKWPDGTTSAVKAEYVDIIQTDWDE